MSVKASLWRRAVLTLVAGAALAFPMGAKADILDGLSIRAGAFMPGRGEARDLIDFASWGGGIEYQIPWFPKLFTGEYWSTSISVDFHYSERKAGIARVLPISINQVYNFEEQNGRTPYAGICLTAAVYGSTGGVYVDQVVRTRNGYDYGRRGQPTITRFGGGVILGLNLNNHFYVEGRYEWFDKHHTVESPEGFRAYLGYRF